MMVAAGEENYSIRSLQSNYDGSYFLDSEEGVFASKK